MRILCDRCKEVDPDPDERFLRVVDISPSDVAENPVYRGVGCSHCGAVGFRGRKAIFEMMKLNAEIRELAFNRESIDVIRNAAIRNGMRTLVQDGRTKILKGMTTPPEVARFAQADTLTAANIDI